MKVLLGKDEMTCPNRINYDRGRSVQKTLGICSFVLYFVFCSKSLGMVTAESLNRNGSSMSSPWKQIAYHPI